MGIAVSEVPGELHHFQQFPAFGILLRWFDAIIVQQWLTNDVLDLHLGIEGGGGVLKDHLDMLPVFPKLLALKLCDILAPEVDLPFAGGIKPDKEAHKSALAAATLPYKAQGFAPVHFQVYIVAGYKLPPAGGGETPGNMLCFQDQVFFVKHSASLPTTVRHSSVSWCRRFESPSGYDPGYPDPQFRRLS